MSVFDDLEAEQDALEAVLARLTVEQWRQPSAAAGWTVTDVVVHLAQTEEGVVATATHTPAPGWATYGDTVDEAMANMVQAEPAPPEEVFERWRVARRESVKALRAADPQQPLTWVAGS